MTVSITSMIALSGGEEIRVCFETVSDGGKDCVRERFTISSKQYLEMGLSKGECSTDVYDLVAYASEVWSAVKRGMSILSCCACSEKALRMKLVSKGFSKESAAQAVGNLVASGALRAEDDAILTAQKMVDKLWGKKRIIAGLYEKGYSQKAIGAALAALEDNQVNYVENCRALIEKRYSELPKNASETQKMISSLGRYGYTLSEIKAAIELL